VSCVRSYCGCDVVIMPSSGFVMTTKLVASTD
jgi:hypothetical protein